MRNIEPVIDWASYFKGSFEITQEDIKLLQSITSQVCIIFQGRMIRLPMGIHSFKFLSDGSFIVKCPDSTGQNIVRLDADLNEVWKIKPPRIGNHAYSNVGFDKGIWFVDASGVEFKLNIDTGDTSDEYFNPWGGRYRDHSPPNQNVTILRKSQLDGQSASNLELVKYAHHQVYLNRRGYRFCNVVQQMTFFEDDRLLGVYEFQKDNRNVLMIAPDDKISWTITPARPEDGYYDSVYEKDGEWFAQGPVNTYRLNIETGEATLLASR